jgi:hypothetical protein
MEDSGSILDKILSTKQLSDMEQFNPSDSLSILLKELTGKEEDILRRRFGLSGEPEQTLEEIGKIYQVTRERIRQIEKAAVAKFRRSRNFNEAVRPVEHLVTTILSGRGGAMEEQSLLDQLLTYSGPSEANRRAVLFFLNELLKDKVEALSNDENFRQAWKLKNVGLDLIKESMRELRNVIEAVGQPVEFNILIEKFHATAFYSEHDQRLSDDIVSSALELSPAIARNPYGEYGLVLWGSIAPKRMNDKILIVLKKEGKPLHFTEIAKRINEAGFDQRKAYPPTVHNELILNKEYVLVGRGIYALREWGYREGVVAEVLVDIITKAGRSMTRDELVQEVLRQRLVKKNTIHLALTNRSLFSKLSNGEYALASQSNQPAQ